MPKALAEILQEVKQLKILLNREGEQHQQAEDLMTVEQAAKFLGMTKSGIYSKIWKKEIPYIKLKGSNRVRLSRRRLTVWLSEGEQELRQAA